MLGLRWGDYVGSPSQAPPAVVLRVTQPRGVASFTALANNEVYGLPERSALVSRYAQEVATALVGAQRSYSVSGAALVSHSYPDGVVRVRLRKHSAPEPLLAPPGDVALLRTHPDASHVWVAYETGKIDVVGLNFSPKELSLSLSDEVIPLFAHSSRINGLELCPEFSVALSGSDDSTAVVWDLKSVCYVRSLPHEGPVTVVAISKTSGDLATVCFKGESRSKLTLFSVNGVLAATQECESAVLSLCFSPAPEGVSCNSLAAGFANGTVRLWSSWDLSPVRDVDTSQASPVVAIAWSLNCQNLYLSTSGRELIVYEKADVTGMGNAPKYVNLTTMA